MDSLDNALKIEYNAEAITESLRRCLAALGIDRGVCKLAKRWWRQEHALRAVIAGIGGPLSNAAFAHVPTNFSEALTTISAGVSSTWPVALANVVNAWLNSRLSVIQSMEDEIDGMDERYASNKPSLIEAINSGELDKIHEAGDSATSVWLRDKASRFGEKDLLSQLKPRIFKMFGSWCILNNLKPWLMGTFPNTNCTAGKHLLDAFQSGLWCLFWSRHCLYWLPNPKISLINGLYQSEEGPTIENQVENIYAIEEYLVPAHAVLRPDLITNEEIKSERNEEVRRILINQFGWSKYLKSNGAVLVERRRNDRDAQFEELYLENNTTNHATFVVSDPSTGRKYALPVPIESRTCQQAQDWMSHGLDKRAIHRS